VTSRPCRYSLMSPALPLFYEISWTTTTPCWRQWDLAFFFALAVRDPRDVRRRTERPAGRRTACSHGKQHPKNRLSETAPCPPVQNMRLKMLTAINWFNRETLKSRTVKFQHFHCEQNAMRDEGVIYVAGHPLLNGRCTRLQGVSVSQNANCNF